MNIEDFDAEFASVADYALLYRELGLQAVPAMSPGRDPSKAWKRPAIRDWKQHQNELASDEQAAEWFPPEYAGNIGAITGACSGNVFVVDLDLQKGPEAGLWWSEMDHMQERAGELETVSQRTGGGGQQLFYRAPDGWIPPTGKNVELNVDIRGQGGFVMIAPSMHESGQRYEWLEGYEPWTIEIAEAPRWLCDELEKLFGQGAVEGAEGASLSQRAAVKTPTPASAIDPLSGAIKDGREEMMREMVWARIVRAYRERLATETEPAPPSAEEQEAMLAELIDDFVNHKVKPRISRPGATRAELLEEEGRGPTAMRVKWLYAMGKWGTKVRRDALAGAPPREGGSIYGTPGASAAPGKSAAQALDDEFNSAIASAPVVERPEIPDVFIAPSEKFFEVLSVRNIFALPDPKWLVRDLFIEAGLSFVFGRPGCGKSFITLGLSLSIAAGLKEWWGHEIEHNGPVIYISSEGETDVKFRLAAWENETGIKIADIPFKFIRASMNFMNPQDVGKLVQTVGEVTRLLETPPVLIVVDTVSRVLPGADENLQKDITLFVEACGKVQKGFRAAVMGVHHSSRSGDNMRGSSVLDAAADAMFLVGREEGVMEGVFVARKIKAAEDGWNYDFALKTVDVVIDPLKPSRKSLFAERMLPDGAAEAAGAGSFGSKQETGSNIVDGRRWPSKDVCLKIVDAIQVASKSDQPWSHLPAAKKLGFYAPARIKDQFGISEEIALHMITRWLNSDVLAFVERTTASEKRGLKRKNGLT